MTQISDWFFKFLQLLRDIDTPMPLKFWHNKWSRLLPIWDCGTTSHRMSLRARSKIGIFLLYVFRNGISPELRRSREIAHLCSDKMTHTKNTIWNRIQNTISNGDQHHPRRRRVSLGARQNLRHLTRKDAIQVSRFPLRAGETVWRAPNRHCSLYGFTLTRNAAQRA
jgi:hypothetical protein